MTRLTPDQREDIRSLLIRFAWDADLGAPADLARYFTEDSHWVLGEQTARGAEAIVDLLLGLRSAGFSGPESGNRHVMSNIDIGDEVEDGHVRVRSVFTLVATSGETPVSVAMGTYHDLIAVFDGHWTIRRREIGSV